MPRSNKHRNSIRSIRGSSLYRIRTNASEPNIFEVMPPSQFRKFHRLGDVLEAQYRCVYKTTRATQTNWRWRVMAERWKHARFIVPSGLPWYSEDEDFQALVLRRKQLRNVEDLKEVRKTRENDKIVDTSDLEFDPYDPNLIVAQPVPSSVKPLYVPEPLRDSEETVWTTTPMAPIPTPSVLLQGPDFQFTDFQ